jgi:TfoX/Sxy family transcriptional regulator of competence genes
MAYNEQLGDRIREALSRMPDLEEKEMFGGLCFMVNGKMCMGVMKDEMMCRIDPEHYEDLVEKPGCRPMAFTGRPMKGMVLVDENAVRNKKDMEFWVEQCLEFNPRAKSSKKKK